MAADILDTSSERRPTVVSLADYRARRDATPGLAGPMRWPWVKRLPTPREVAHRRLMLQHLTSRG